MFHSMKGLKHMAPRDTDDFLDEMYLHMKDASAPKRVSPVPRFHDNMSALRKIDD